MPVAQSKSTSSRRNFVIQAKEKLWKELDKSKEAFALVADFSLSLGSTTVAEPIKVILNKFPTIASIDGKSSLPPRRKIDHR